MVKNCKKIINAIITVCLTFTMVGCKMIEKTPKRIAKQVAFKYDGKKVLREDIDSRIVYLQKSLEKQYGNDLEKNKDAQTQLFESRKEVANILLTNMVMESEVKALKLKVDEAKINEDTEKSFKETKKNFKTDEEFKNALKNENLTEATLKERLRSDIAAQANLDALSEYYTKDIKDVSEEEAKTHYATNQDKYTKERNGFKLQEIILNTKEDAEKTITDLKAGADFEKLIDERSTDDISKSKRGNVDFIEAKSIVYSPKYAHCANSKTGDIVGPKEIDGKYYVVKVVENVQSPPKPYSEVKAEIIKTLTDAVKEQKFTEEQNKLLDSKQKKIKIYEDNLK